MALIEDFHVVATHYPIGTNQTIREGEFVELDAAGAAVRTTGSATTNILGVAGDSTAESNATHLATHLSANITINAAGNTVRTRPRVSDPAGDETRASGRLTVYNGGGQFHTDIFETLDGVNVLTYNPGESLHVSANGRLTTTATSVQVGVCVVAPRAYPSGVPGTDTADGSISLGTFMTFKLNI
jgi:hypothetical protein